MQINMIKAYTYANTLPIAQLSEYSASAAILDPHWDKKSATLPC